VANIRVAAQACVCRLWAVAWVVRRLSLVTWQRIRGGWSTRCAIKIDVLTGVAADTDPVKWLSGVLWSDGTSSTCGAATVCRGQREMWTLPLSWLSWLSWSSRHEIVCCTLGLSVVSVAHCRVTKGRLHHRPVEPVVRLLWPVVVVCRVHGRLSLSQNVLELLWDERISLKIIDYKLP